MKIEVLPLGYIKANCYLLSDENAAVVIDPGIYSQKVEEFLTENSGKERMILITHSHFDHICGAKELRDNTGVKIAIGEKDAPALTDTQLSLSDRFHAHQEPFCADWQLHDRQELTVGNLIFTAIETPGHTVGGMCYLTGTELFSGDTLFLESVGRTDFEGANQDILMQSVKKLLLLEDDVTVYPGHGGATTIGHERRYNPFL